MIGKQKMKAQIIWSEQKGKYLLVANGKTLTSSGNPGHLNYLVKQQKHSAILKAKVTEVEIVTAQPKEPGFKITDQAGNEIASVAPSFDIEERFRFLEELIMLVVDGDAKSLAITGRGGVGKSFTVIDVMKKAGKVNVNEIEPSIADLEEIQVKDESEEIEAKIMKQITRPRGDYVVIKGYITAKALYRIMYDYRDRTIIFDDCDKVLKDGTCVSLLKAALDSYEDRWVSWAKDQMFGESDIPTTFKFTGKIMFISNMRLDELDEAIRTRCFKVDLTMTKEQSIQRMRSVLPHVMPDVDMDLKVEALDLLEENLDITDDINFRSLMNLITIRKSGSPDWKRLGTYLLTENA
jgi:hypothetical protein